MSSSVKIRILLLLLTLCFVSAALRINLSFKKEEVLEQDAQTIESNLHKKEIYVQGLLHDRSFIDSLKNIDHNVEWVRKLIPALRDEHRVFVSTYRNNELNFYGAIQFLMPTDSLIKEGSSFLTAQNGWYEAIKATNKNFSVVFIIPVKARYPHDNKFLQNTFSPDLIKTDNLDIATLYDDHVKNIRNVDGRYLFSVKLKSSATKTYYSGLELCMWLLALITSVILINNLCVWLARQGFIKGAVLALFCLLLTFRLADLHYGWFEHHFELEIFNPKYYGTNQYFQSIGAFFLNLLALTWLFSFIYSFRYKLRFFNPHGGKIYSYAMYTLLGLVLVFASYQINDLFYGLIKDSKIVFDLTNVLNLNWTSWLGITILCFTVLCLYLLMQSLFAFSEKLNLTLTERLHVFVAFLTALLLEHLLFEEFNLFFLFFSAVVFLSGWAFYKRKRQFSTGLFIITVLLFSVVASAKLAKFQSSKEREARQTLASKLESPVDPDAVLLFIDIEKQILHDHVILDHFIKPSSNSLTYQDRLKDVYFAGYLSRFKLSSYEYNSKDSTLNGKTDTRLETFKKQVIRGSTKLSDYFYRSNKTFGIESYFAILPIKNGNEKAGTLVVQLTAKPFNDAESFPEILEEGKVKESFDSKQYSVAYYNNNKLLNQQGKYVYDIINRTFSGKVKDYVFVSEIGSHGKEYSHLIYKPNFYKLIVISKEVNSLLTQIASVSFIFLILLFFAFLVFFAKWLWRNFYNLRWDHLVRTNRLLYKTRIQVSMVSAVVITLIISGIITYINISKQYREQQEETILGKVNKMSAVFNKQLLKDGSLVNDAETEAIFNSFAELNAADLNLYNLDGSLLQTTQPKIYESGLTARKMNALAYLYLNKLHKSEFINKEAIGDLKFIAAYVPLKNNEGEPKAYLGLPYFSNEQDYEERIGVFLNALVNVYALVFVAIGFFAVFVANRITNPLTIIEKSLSETKIGRKNEPIQWKRNDEIGNLIKEYNNMIAALEESAHRLARSERESAWREMAKQVAHEIKNPLTPLKLGVQLLDKSWKEKDPKFNIKFEKFTKSFIEQIESLAHIASEFSNFAKMPDTVLDRIDVKKVLHKSIDLYKHTENMSVLFDDQTTDDIFINADKDQLLRCFNNLIKNAIEAMPVGRAGRVDVMMHCENKILYINIKDNGCGIAEGLRDRIFVPNFTTKSSGTGLGLAFVKQAIENMDGSIRFETEENTGTTFYITFPVV